MAADAIIEKKYEASQINKPNTVNKDIKHFNYTYHVSCSEIINQDSVVKSVQDSNIESEILDLNDSDTNTSFEFNNKILCFSNNDKNIDDFEWLPTQYSCEEPKVNDIRMWAIESKVPKAHLNSLLKILNKRVRPRFQ